MPNEEPERIIRDIRGAVEGVKGVDARVELSANVQPAYLIEKEHEVVGLAVDSVRRTVGYKPQLRIGLGRTDSMYLYHVAGIKTVSDARIGDTVTDAERPALRPLARLYHGGRRLLQERVRGGWWVLPGVPDSVD